VNRVEWLTLIGLVVAIVPVGNFVYGYVSGYYSGEAAVDRIYVSCANISDFLNSSIIEFGVSNPSSESISADWYVTMIDPHQITFADEKIFGIPAGQVAHPTFNFPVNSTEGALIATGIVFHQQFLPVRFLATYHTDSFSYARSSVSGPTLPHLPPMLPNCASLT
jgi:hypothetical protein